MNARIPIAGPWVTEREVRLVAEAAAEGWYDGADRYVSRFEEAFAEYVGVKHAIALPHCTSALHLALIALGVGPGDEVIVPETTWIASAAPITYVGATPVFADIDERTWCLSVASAERKVGPRTRGIIAVGLYGLTPDMTALRDLASTRGLFIVEDAAQCLGAVHAGRSAGSLGDLAAFSFHGTKTMTTGEGGMFVTDSTDLFERADLLRDHGRARKDKKKFYNTEIAYKYRMSNLQAAFGLAQLERIEELVAKKRQLFAWYQERLSGVPGIWLNAEPEGTTSTFWMTTVVLDPAYKLSSQDLMAAFDDEGIDTRPFFHPLSSLPAYAATASAAHARRDNPVAYDLHPRGLNLPSALRLGEVEVDRVCSVLKRLLGVHRDA